MYNCTNRYYGQQTSPEPHDSEAERDHLAAIERVLADPIAAIDAVRERHPLLGSHGFGEREPFPTGDHVENFRRLRAEMTEPHQVGQFIRAVEFLATRRNRKTLNKEHSSYGLKHSAESWCRRRVGYSADVYVSNGMFIAAALALGFRAEPIRWSSINAWTSVGAPLIRE